MAVNGRRHQANRLSTEPQSAQANRGQFRPHPVMANKTNPAVILYTSRFRLAHVVKKATEPEYEAPVQTAK